MGRSSLLPLMLTMGAMGAMDTRQTVKLPIIPHKGIATAIKTKRKERKLQKKLAKKQHVIASAKAAILLKERRKKARIIKSKR